MAAILPINLTLYGQQVEGIQIPIGSSVLWTFLVEDPFTRTPIDLTVVDTAVVLGVCALDPRGNPILPATFAHEADITGSPINKCTVPWAPGDTIPSGTPLTPGFYAVDVWFTDADGNRLQLLGRCLVELTAVSVLPDTDVTPVPSTAPLGRGLPGIPIVLYTNFAAFPDPTTETGRFAYDRATDILWISNGTAWVEAGGTLPTATEGQFLRYTSGAWRAVTLTQDMIAAAFTASISSGPSTPVEVGASIVNPAFGFTYNRSAAAATINDGTGAVSVSSPFTSYTYSKTYTVNTVNGSTTWTLTANETGGPSKTATWSVSWRPRVFYDSVVPGTIDASFIAALTGQALASGLARTISFSAGGGTKKYYYAFPTSYGAPSSFKDASTGFGIPFSKVGSAISVTNGYGVAITYDVWASDEFLTDAVNVQVS